MHFSARIVPFDGKPAVSFAVPIARTLIILLYHVQKMLHVFSRRQILLRNRLRQERIGWGATCATTVQALSRSVCSRDFIGDLPRVPALLSLPVGDHIFPSESHNILSRLGSQSPSSGMSDIFSCMYSYLAIGVLK